MPLADRLAASDVAGFVAGGGEMGALIRAHDWSATPLGPIETWPQSLKTVVDLIIASPLAMIVLWGPELVQIYNDGYRDIMAARHPSGLGQPTRECWPEVWRFNAPVYDAVRRGESRSFTDQKLTIERLGRAEDAWFDLTYSPVRDDGGAVGGVLVTVVETTAKVRAEASLRASEALRDSEARHRSLLAAAERRAAELQAVLESMPDAVYIGGSEGITLANQAALDQLGFATCDDLNRHVATLAEEIETRDAETGARIAPEEEAFLRALGGERVVQDVRVRHRSTGEDRVVRCAAGPVVINGEVIAAVAVNTDVTERRVAEEALRVTSRRLNAVLDNASVAIFLMGDEHQCVYMNPAAERLTGYTLAETQGRHLHDVIHHTRPDGSPYPSHECPIDSVCPGSDRQQGEEVFIDKSGRFFPVAFSASSIRDENGAVVGTIVEVQDISERKATDARLRELNRTLEQRVEIALAERKVLADVVESSTAAIMVCGLDYQILAINRANVDAFERVYGKRPKPGDNLLMLVDLPEERARIARTWGRAIAGEAFVVVDEFGDPTRERAAYEVRFNILRDREGRQIAAVQTAYDVSERVRAEARIAEAEAARREADALYRAYFENTPEALFLIGVEADGGFVVEQINPAHEAGVGLKFDDIRGKRIEDILPPAIAERVRETYRRVVETGAVHQYREEFDLTGDPQHWDTSLVPMRNAEGRIVRLIGSSRNVTRQVLAEEALRQSQKMEAMGQLTGGVAHDFNNLLTPIVGSLDMLQRKRLGGEREQRLVAGAMQSAERAKTLVQRLLAFARRQPLQSVPVDVAKLVTGMGDLIESTTGPQIKVVVEAPSDLPAALADPNQLEMALLNLSVNARDAMAEGGTLRISAHAERVREGHKSQLRPGAYVRLSVADTGAGMDDATLARAVEPFFSTKGVGRGTGLGLSMVHGLASQLGGALTIGSRPGVGTTVELWLPQSAALPEPIEAGPEAVAEVEARGTALLVDDEELVRLSTADMLHDLGYAVIEAASAEEAMKLVGRGEPFDLLVTDHLMPGMNGTDLARAVRIAKPAVPVLLISGYAESEGIEPGLPRLTKPFRKDELASSLAQLSG